jgi:hypothetical protein
MEMSDLPTSNVLVSELRAEIGNPDDSGAPYVNNPDLLARCLTEIERLQKVERNAVIEIHRQRDEIIKLMGDVKDDDGDSSSHEPDAEVSVLIDRVNARIPSSVTPSTRIEIHPSEWLRLADALRPAQPPCVWQPIETAPRDREVLFWIVPLSPEETYTDTSGNPIVSNAPPHLLLCRYGRWSSISKASHWADVPRAPVTKSEGQS